jgi:hypothetical protein
MISKLVYAILFTGGIGCLLGCHKKDFLNQKPSSDLFVPSTLQDFQALLDNDTYMSETPVLGELSSDNFYVKYPFWQTLTPKERNAYIWAPDIYQGIGSVGDWNFPYQQVFYANVVLDGIPKVAITSSNAQTWNTIKGSALFIRAYAFYNLAQIFAPVYDNNTADKPNSGIPLRLNPNVDEASHRSTVNQTYTQILSDLLEAKDLLQDSVPVANLNRPSKPAAFAMLARVYLSMGMYGKAGAYADSCLHLHGDLIDYNTLSGSPLPFNKSNQETLYQSKLLSSTDVLKGLIYKDCIVDTTLYRLYNKNDLRHSIFYTSPPLTDSTLINPKGSYNGSIFLFSGLATDEALLIRAECSVRLGNRSAGMSDLNSLLRKRWKTGTYVDTTADSDDAALNIILTERRKELPFRGLRWTDLRRLNKEGANITLTRSLNGQSYQLNPNSPLYVLPIPPDVIQLSNIPQNNR